MEGATNKNEYDLNSAVTFLLVGLGIGSVLALAFNPKLNPKLNTKLNTKQRATPEEIKSWHMSGSQPQSEAEERVA
jgi:hypothetical protein